jgi:hypothetical protein
VSPSSRSYFGSKGMTGSCSLRRETAPTHPGPHPSFLLCSRWKRTYTTPSPPNRSMAQWHIPLQRLYHPLHVLATSSPRPLHVLATSSPPSDWCHSLPADMEFLVFSPNTAALPTARPSPLPAIHSAARDGLVRATLEFSHDLSQYPVSRSRATLLHPHHRCTRIIVAPFSLPSLLSVP